MDREQALDLIARRLVMVAQTAGRIVNLVLRIVDFDQLDATLKRPEPFGPIAMRPHSQSRRLARPDHSPNRCVREAIETAS